MSLSTGGAGRVQEPRTGPCYIGRVSRNEGHASGFLSRWPPVGREGRGDEGAVPNPSKNFEKIVFGGFRSLGFPDMVIDGHKRCEISRRGKGSYGKSKESEDDEGGNIPASSR
jgi:hypothetical protein